MLKRQKQGEERWEKAHGNPNDGEEGTFRYGKPWGSDGEQVDGDTVDDGHGHERASRAGLQTD